MLFQVSQTVCDDFTVLWSKFWVMHGLPLKNCLSRNNPFLCKRSERPHLITSVARISFLCFYSYLPYCATKTFSYALQWISADFKLPVTEQTAIDTTASGQFKRCLTVLCWAASVDEKASWKWEAKQFNSRWPEPAGFTENWQHMV